MSVIIEGFDMALEKANADAMYEKINAYRQTEEFKALPQKDRNIIGITASALQEYSASLARWQTNIE